MLWKTLKFLGVKKGKKGNVPWNKDGAVQCEPCKNAKFCKKLAASLAKKLPIAPSRFNSVTTKDYYASIFNSKRNKFQLFNISEDVVKKNLFYVNTNKAAGMDQISAKFPKEAAGMLAYPLSRIIDLSVKLSVFPKE